jgi:hypothetical protein
MQVSMRERKANLANAIAQVQQAVREPARKPFRWGKPVAFPPGPKGQTTSGLVIVLCDAAALGMTLLQP